MIQLGLGVERPGQRHVLHNLHLVFHRHTDDPQRQLVLPLGQNDGRVVAVGVVAQGYRAEKEKQA